MHLVDLMPVSYALKIIMYFFRILQPGDMSKMDFQEGDIGPFLMT